MMEERLWDYIDGLSSPGERSAIETLIAENAEWKGRYRELLNIHQLANTSELEEPSMRFTKNVMDEIARLQVTPAAQKYINKNIIRGIGAFFITMITGFLVYLIAQIKWTSSGGGSKNFIADERINQELDKISWSKYLNGTSVNIFLLITVVLGLMLLDMYLQRKRQERHKVA